jgi:hypothetical protein
VAKQLGLDQAGVISTGAVVPEASAICL